LKILVVGNYFYPEHIGGVEIVTFNLVKYYREAGHDVRWVAADVPPRFREVVVGDLPIRAWNITEERFGFPQPIPSPYAIIKLYRSVSWCDIVHLQDCLYLINIFAFIAAKLRGKPIVITQHTELIPYKDKIKGWLQSLAMQTIGVLMHKHANTSVFISENTRDNLPIITSKVKEFRVIRNGVDTGIYRPLESDVKNRMRRDLCGDSQRPILLFVGRFVSIKGIQYLVPLIEKHPEWHWLLVGRPDEYNPLKWEYKNMTFWPSLDSDGMRNAYAIADLSIHPSEVIGMSLTILECMACGTPVIVNKAALYGVPEKDFEYFILTEPNTEKIEATIEFWIKNAEKQNALARRVLDYVVRQSSWREVARKYLNILEKNVSQ